MMQGFLYEEGSLGIFLLVTVLIGGWGAWTTGRAMAAVWHSSRLLVVYLAILALAVRFIHFALFSGTLLSIHYYVIDYLVLLVIGLVGYRYTRTRQMVERYYWLYEATGPLTWREKDSAV